MHRGQKADHSTRFQFIHDGKSESGNSNKSICKHCSKAVTWTSASRLKQHLQSCKAWREENTTRKITMPLVQSRLTEKGIHHMSTGDLQRLQLLAATAIIATGRPFGMLGHDAWARFFTEAIPGFRPPTRSAVTRLLPSIYANYRALLIERLRKAPYLNLIFDASDTVASHRIINIAVQLPNQHSFYWRTFDTGETRHTTENYITMIWPEMEQICNGNWSRINSICTDTDGVMRSVHDALAKTPELKHCFFSLCDSHGLQLLVKDILTMEPFNEVFTKATAIVAFFSKSKLQLSRLRTCQKEAYPTGARALIKSVITRWGSQYNALWSVAFNREALRAYARRPDVHDALKSNRDHVLLPAILETINSGSFWEDLEAIVSVLKPINSHQHASEGDRANIGHVIPRWLNIKAAWQTLETSQQYRNVPWDEVYRVWKVRFDTQTYPIHWAANALRPETVVEGSGNSKLEAEGFRCVMGWLQDLDLEDSNYRDLLREFNQFRNQSGGLYRPTDIIYDLNFQPQDAWDCCKVLGSPLAKIAVRVFGTLANSVPSERSFSAINFIHSKTRNRLLPMNADMQAFIFMNYAVLNGVATQQKARRWDQLDEKGWLELEDSYMDYFSHDSNDTREGQLISEFGEDRQPILRDLPHQQTSIDERQTVVLGSEFEEGADEEMEG